jgi:hypothetical protein
MAEQTFGLKQIRGVTAELQWGYHRAGTVRNWTAVRGESGWHLTGTLTDINTFALQQRLVFEVQHRLGVWRWPVLEVLSTGASFTAMLGPKER